MKVVPASAGFSSMSTRRSAWLAVISSHARISRRRVSLQRQIAACAAVPGFRRMTRSHSGLMPSAAISFENRAKSGFTTADMSRPPRLLHLRARDLHGLRVALGVGPEELRPLVPRGADGIDAEALHALDHVGKLDHARHVGADLDHDVARRPGEI